MMLKIDTIIFFLWAYSKSIWASEHTFLLAASAREQDSQNFINSSSDNRIDFYVFVSLAYSALSLFRFFRLCDLIPPMLLLLRVFFMRSSLVPRRTGKKVINNFEVDNC